MKNILFCSDFHCGVAGGLTPPGWIPRDNRPGYVQLNALMREDWRECIKLVRSLPPIDIIAFAGDAINGKERKQGGRYVIVPEMFEQADMAIKTFRTIKDIHPTINHIFMAEGSGYHVDCDGENMEKKIADCIGAVYDSEIWFSVNSTLFRIKHKIGKSNTPGGGDKSLRNKLMNNKERFVMGQEPLANMLLYGHIHECKTITDNNINNRYLMTSPALQTFSLYGKKDCDSLVHWGMVFIQVDEKGIISWKKHIKILKHSKPIIHQTK